MFKKLDSKLKAVGECVLILGSILGIVAFILCLANLGDASTIEKIYYTIGLVSSIAFIIGCILSAWIFYGIGVAVENSELIISKQSKIISMLENSKDNQETTEKIHTLQCKSCGNTISKTPCPFCGKE